jgi:hypothetical protein
VEIKVEYKVMKVKLNWNYSGDRKGREKEEREM